jgi:hypothetical protein
MRVAYCLFTFGVDGSIQPLAGYDLLFTIYEPRVGGGQDACIPTRLEAAPLPTCSYWTARKVNDPGYVGASIKATMIACFQNRGSVVTQTVSLRCGDRRLSVRWYQNRRESRRRQNLRTDAFTWSTAWRGHALLLKARSCGLVHDF